MGNEGLVVGGDRAKAIDGEDKAEEGFHTAGRDRWVVFEGGYFLLTSSPYPQYRLFTRNLRHELFTAGVIQIETKNGLSRHPVYCQIQVQRDVNNR